MGGVLQVEWGWAGDHDDIGCGLLDHGRSVCKYTGIRGFRTDQRRSPLLVDIGDTDDLAEVLAVRDRDRMSESASTGPDYRNPQRHFLFPP
jgi:hypothetical protein